jgi:zinc transport system ATP-binding protein
MANRLPLLEIDAVSVRRDGRVLVSDVSIAVEPATIHLLVGPNGAGKSTLFNAVLGLAEFSGSIRFHWRRSGRIGYVPQSFNVDRTLPLTVGEFLALARQRRPVCFGTSRTLVPRLEALLVRVGLADFLDRPLGALSGGELQRVLLANALDPVPELLLLDEPIGGLDESASRQFEDVLREQRDTTGTSTLMVSHDLDHVRRIADQVTLLDRRVLRSGPPASVLAENLAESLSAPTASP